MMSRREPLFNQQLYDVHINSQKSVRRKHGESDNRPSKSLRHPQAIIRDRVAPNSFNSVFGGVESRLATG